MDILCEFASVFGDFIISCGYFAYKGFLLFFHDSCNFV